MAAGGPEAEALEQEILSRLVALNHERAAEERRGIVRWLRPEYQAPGGNPESANPESPQEAEAREQTDLDLPEGEISEFTNPRISQSTNPPIPESILTWPDTLPAQVAAVRSLLPATGPDAEALSARFGKKNKVRLKQIEAILETLRGLGLG